MYIYKSSSNFIVEVLYVYKSTTNFIGGVLYVDKSTTNFIEEVLYVDKSTTNFIEEVLYVDKSTTNFIGGVLYVYKNYSAHITSHQKPLIIVTFQRCSMRAGVSQSNILFVFGRHEFQTRTSRESPISWEELLP